VGIISAFSLSICISELLLELLNCPGLVKHGKQSYFCNAALWSRLPLVPYCCWWSFSSYIKAWGRYRSVGTDRPIFVLWRKQKLYLQNHLYLSMYYQITQQDELDLI